MSGGAKGALLGMWLAARGLARRGIYFVRFFGRNVTVDPSAYVSRRSVIRVRGGSLRIGAGCEIHDYAMLMTYGGDIDLGRQCSLNPFAIVYGHGGVRIGEGVRIAAHTVIIPANHNVPEVGRPLHEAGVTTQGIEIGDHVWLGSGARILDGVRIGDNAVVAAGSVVTRSVPAGTVVAGVPARPLERP